MTTISADTTSTTTAIMPDLSAMNVAFLLILVAGYFLYEKYKAYVTPNNLLKLLEYAAKLTKHVFTILEDVNKMVHISLEIKEAYDKLRGQETAAERQWRFSCFAVCLGGCCARCCQQGYWEECVGAGQQKQWDCSDDMLLLSNESSSVLFEILLVEP
ncbi:hypothetical protein BO94DRAFT_577994 [Aspergillus sclerotioniger CBS 115572]|uniref:Uncharacterized protein n=1 Tax=Aspergillus sclerotioniger CBS 115572 TaxID=1450535 RepID=A0A317VLP1_9EURO|nr:hypothetical protein BO94DRAFT_577994 [Aspergillus sclerotioniger CBS 115572]PWY75284.1 hypothetical protein BO94DRAFT_577994 [Aspergillus sclerotioniger CBS 115572]